jgi:hypothetical protein
MIQFLEDLKGRGKAPLTPDERKELEKLRKKKIELLKVKKQLEDDGDGKKGKGDEDSGDSSGVIPMFSYILIE